ncbi:DinB family protein [Klenkia sp. PcliD-1-E]|uniref:DinB family protein n=1 Tax=Klenkia sp. PcliD-1-E TaxID=2954492 RepID=UPI00209834D6|nr:DinB family protein [Klenkia sp. PcliD-1-E]MCO7218918.1 DinB family protein [Klenkia sp. PcliD-1-E]
MTHGAPEFDWDVLSRPDVVSLVTGQLSFSWWDLHQHLQDLPDEEYLWKPAPTALSIAPRGQTDRRAVGAGEWVVEWPDGPDDPGPRTIAWLVAHLVEVFAERYEWTFGGHRLRRDDLELAHPTAQAGVAALSEAVGRWREGVEASSAEEMWTVGRSQATPIDQQAPFAHLVLHLNRELVHHGAEITVLRDLHRTRAPE